MEKDTCSISKANKQVDTDGHFCYHWYWNLFAQGAYKQSINQSINNQSKNWLFDHSIDQEIDLVVYLTSETKYPNFCTKPMQRFFVLPTIAYNAKWEVLVLFFKACWRYQLTFFRQFRSQIRSHSPYIKCPLLRRKISPTEDDGYGLNGEAPTSEGYRKGIVTCTAGDWDRASKLHPQSHQSKLATVRYDHV